MIIRSRQCSSYHSLFWETRRPTSTDHKLHNSFFAGAEQKSPEVGSMPGRFGAQEGSWTVLWSTEHSQNLKPCFLYNLERDALQQKHLKDVKRCPKNIVFNCEAAGQQSSAVFSICSCSTNIFGNQRDKSATRDHLHGVLGTHEGCD